MTYAIVASPCMRYPANNAVGIRMTPEEESSDVREMVWEMSRTTNKILILGIILILAILAVLMYSGILSQGGK